MITYNINLIKAEYESGASLKKLSKKYNLNQRTVRSRLIKIGVAIREVKRIPLNENYFSEIDTEFKAYVLGFLFSDGSLTKLSSGNVGRVVLALSEKDGSILEEIKKDMGYEGKIHLYVDKNGPRRRKSLAISNKKMANDLMALGMKNRKTFDGGCPIVPKKFMPSFILGYFDGDGSFSSYEDKWGSVRPLYGIFSCFDHIKFIKDYLDEVGIKNSISKKGIIFVLSISGGTQTAKFFQLIYSQKDNLRSCLWRKHDKAKYFIGKTGSFLKLKYGIPIKVTKKNLVSWANKNLSNEDILSFKEEWDELCSLENFSPSIESTARFLEGSKTNPMRILSI